MINLEKTTGLKLYYKNNKLVSPNLVIPKANIRKLSDMKYVLSNPKLAKGSKSIYYMYRGIHLPDHNHLFSKYKMRWDVTVVLPGKIGNEFVKTVGHHHKGVEIYEVLYGEALYVFENDKEFLVIHARAGSRVFIPSEYWHVTINHTNNLLIMANLMPENVKSNYNDIKRKHGMAYYYVKGNRFVANKNYKKLPKMKRLKAKKFKVPIYWEFISEPDKFKLR